ncbi:MAG: hypothetical protein FWF76_01060 [Oscillospiraceae bacterium]|nr:hypothetical protein [Oscillospiraceae bacterium]
MDERRELLKLKQGLVTDDETSLETHSNSDKPHIERPVGFSAIMSNFYYHYKLHVFIIVFFVLVIAGLIFLTLGGEKPDLTVLFISGEHESSSFFRFEGDTLQKSFEQFTPDFSGNNNIYVKCLFIDLISEGRDPRSVHGNTVKLFGEIQGANALIFVGDRKTLEQIPGGETGLSVEEFYLNLYERFGEHPNIVDDFFFRIKGSSLAAGEGIEFNHLPIPEDLYMVVRTNLDTARLNPNRAQDILDNAIEVVDAIMNE